EAARPERSAIETDRAHHTDSGDEDSFHDWRLSTNKGPTMLSSRLTMKAMLLAAGLGERMRPLTDLLPKPALPVLGRPLAVIVLHRLALQGMSTVVVNLHHRPDALRELLSDGRELGLKHLIYSFEETILGTAGGLRNAARHLRGGDTILVRNAD